MNTNSPDIQWEKVITEIDENGDGEISLEEFITMMSQLITPVSDQTPNKINK